MSSPRRSRAIQHPHASDGSSSDPRSTPIVKNRQRQPPLTWPARRAPPDAHPSLMSPSKTRRTKGSASSSHRRQLQFEGFDAPPVSTRLRISDLTSEQKVIFVQKPDILSVQEADLSLQVQEERIFIQPLNPTSRPKILYIEKHEENIAWHTEDLSFLPWKNSVEIVGQCSGFICFLDTLEHTVFVYNTNNRKIEYEIPIPEHQASVYGFGETAADSSFKLVQPGVMSSDFHVLDASTKQWVRYSCGVESVVRYRGHGVYVPKHSVLLWMAELIVEKKKEDINQTKGSGDSMNKDTEWAMIAFKIGPLKSEKRSWTVEAPTGLQLSTMYLGPGSDDSILGCGYSKNGVFKVYSLSRFVDGEWRWTKLASIEIDVNISKYIPITSFMKTEEEMYLCLLMDDSSIMAFRSLYPVTEKWLSMVLFSDMPGKFHAAYCGSRNFLMDMKTEGPKQQTKMQRGPKQRLLKQD